MSKVSTGRNRRGGRSTTVVVSRPRVTARSLGLDTIKIKGSNDPKTTRTDLLVQQWFTANILLGKVYAPISADTLKPWLPTGIDRIRFQKISVYGDDTNDLHLDLSADNSTFHDFGVPGSRRAAIHVQPALALRQRWVELSDKTTLFTIKCNTVDSISFNCIIQVLLDVRTIQGANENYRL